MYACACACLCVLRVSMCITRTCACAEHALRSFRLAGGSGGGRMEHLLEELAPDAAVLGCTAPTSSLDAAGHRSELPVPLLPPMVLGGQHVRLLQRPRWLSGPPTAYGPDGPHPPLDSKRPVQETHIALAKRWRQARADGAAGGRIQAIITAFSCALGFACTRRRVTTARRVLYGLHNCEG